MRILSACLVIGGVVGCGNVQSEIDAAVGTIDSPKLDSSIDGPANDAPTDAPTDAPPTGPTPVLYWAMDNSVANTGALTGYTLTTPAGISYGTGKFGQAATLAAGQYSYVDGMRASLDTYAKLTIGLWMKEPGNVGGTAFLDCDNRSTAPYGGVQLGLSGTSVSVCVSSTSNSFLGGDCSGFTAPTANAWHHWILRYDGSGTAAGQGGPTQIYVDDVLVHTRANDVANNPVFNTTGTPDRLYVGASTTSVDDVRIYNQVFSPADQCTYIIRGTWNGTSCALP